MTATIAVPSIGKTAVIERSLGAPATPHVTPGDPDVLELLRRVKEHPEIVLSRRELIRYVLATPGQRAEEVQALLHLDQVEQVRLGLQKIANSCEKQLMPLGTAATQPREHFLLALEIPEMTKEKVLAAANAQRAILDLPALADLTPQISLKDGMATPRPAKPQRIPKAQAIADVRAVRELLEEITSRPVAKRVADLKADLTALAGDPAAAASVAQESFYATGMELITGESCPFCDSSWDLGALKKHVQAKIDRLKDASRKCKAVESKTTPLVAIIQPEACRGRLLSMLGIPCSLKAPP